MVEPGLVHFNCVDYVDHVDHQKSQHWTRPTKNAPKMRDAPASVTKSSASGELVVYDPPFVDDLPLFSEIRPDLLEPAAGETFWHFLAVSKGGNSLHFDDFWDPLAKMLFMTPLIFSQIWSEGGVIDN